MKRMRLLFIACIIVLCATVAANVVVFTNKHQNNAVTVSSDSTAQVIAYKGQNGKDALTLLKQQVSVGQANSGLVTTINGVKADNTKHQYWAFYINGHLASIGPADYQTKNKDTITWKMEKY